MGGWVCGLWFAVILSWMDVGVDVGADMDRIGIGIYGGRLYSWVAV